MPDEPFIPLTEEEEAQVHSALSAKNRYGKEVSSMFVLYLIQSICVPLFRRKVLVTHATSNIDITGEVLQCLTPSAWLNDEVPSAS